MIWATSDSASLWTGSIATVVAVILTILGGLWQMAKRRAEDHARTEAFMKLNSDEHRSNSDKIDALADTVNTKIDAVVEQVGNVRDDVRDMRRDFVRHLENHEKD